MEQPQELPEVITKGTKTYIQLRNTDKVYLYQVTDNDPNNKHIYYEVFYRRIDKAKIFSSGSILPNRVLYPYNEAFGNWAWCISRGNDHLMALRVATNKFNFIDKQTRIKQSA
ncbi:hypothetical protein A5M85_05900 [Cellulophaga lytica]|uniref:hypothetical protein n=1 Tax=Cellulophaga lytica TaxID=979 RepID=UPI000950AC63|nr:hypothetical protein [Cellulophaga lytica]APU09828.1 hypothetical protein A5M85_05900 [Cellulophaga lytica]